MSDLAAAILESIDADTLLDRIVAEASSATIDRLAHRLGEARSQATRNVEDRWLDTKGAAAHLSITPNALHKLTATRMIPFEQEGPGCKCWFRRSDLDEWRRSSSRGLRGA